MLSRALFTGDQGYYSCSSEGVRTTRSSIHSHHFQFSLPNPRILSRKSSFIPRTCNLRKVLPSSCLLLAFFLPSSCLLLAFFLPSSCLPESYNLPSFKSMINKLDLIFLSPLAFYFLVSSFAGALYRPPWLFLNVIYKKSKNTKICHSIHHWYTIETVNYKLSVVSGMCIKF